MTKDSLNELVKQLPEQFSLEELLDRIILLSKIESGLAQSQASEIVSTPELRERLKKWLS